MGTKCAPILGGSSSSSSSNTKHAAALHHEHNRNHRIFASPVAELVLLALIATDIDAHAPALYTHTPLYIRGSTIYIYIRKHTHTIYILYARGVSLGTLCCRMSINAVAVLVIQG